MKTQQLTIPQYADKIKKSSRQAVLKAVKKKKLHLLPSVVDIKKIGRDYILEVAI